MKNVFSAAALAIVIGVAFGSAVVQSKTLRWSSQGDAATLDPHAQNESFTNQFNGQIYEQL